MVTQHTIELLGTQFSVKTDVATEHFDEILDILRRRIDDIQNSVPVRDSLKIVILASIAIIDEWLTERKGIEEFERVTQRLIVSIDEALDRSKEPL